MVDELAISAFQHQMLTWYDTFKRCPPWGGDPDPYHILASEIMLHQTQHILTTYSPGSFYDTFEPAEGQQLAEYG